MTSNIWRQAINFTNDEFLSIRILATRVIDISIKNSHLFIHGNE